MFLVDTSAWIEFFRKGSRIRLQSICAPEQVTIVLPVYQEVLQGLKDEGAFHIARDALMHARFVENPLGQEVFEEAIGLYRLTRAKGITVRSSVDCLIAACAIRHGLVVLHRDRDYTGIAKVSALRERRI